MAKTPKGEMDYIARFLGSIPTVEELRGTLNEEELGTCGKLVGMFPTRKRMDKAIRKLVSIYDMATTDGLTDLPNRGSFLRYAEEGLKKTRGPSSIAIIDLDHFKNINDTYGHAVGDKVLKRFARTLRHNTRHQRNVNDVVGKLRRREYDSDTGRWGGEEFGVFLPGVSPVTAKYILERFQGELAGHARRYLGVFEKHVERRYQRKLDDEEKRLAEHLSGISFSAGIAPLEKYGDISVAIVHADKALYKAKEAGRRCVYVWGEL